MSFKRNDVQEFIEAELGCYNRENWTSYKPSLLTWEINSSNITQIKRCVESDINSYFFKGLQSFAQALHEIRHRKYAWSIVKLYYTVFYLLRCEILLSNHILLRCKSLYYAKIKNNEKLSLYNPNTFKGDHQLTIGLVKKLHNSMELNDPILDNDINGDNPYLWFMKNRDRVNYYMKNFTDPSCDITLNHIDSYFRDNELYKLFSFYNSKTDYSICFDEDHSILAIPYKKIMSIYKRIENSINYTFEEKRKLIITLDLLNKAGISKEEVDNLIL